MFLAYLRRLKHYILSSLDHTKQAAIMLMAGHTPKPKQPTPKPRPSFIVKRPSPVRGKMRGSNISGVSPLGVTPTRSSVRAAARASEEGSVDTS
ncbi:jg27042, partial [Pararge aegeria aegeria]